MNLFIQIPCLNEEDSIEKTLRSIPKKIHGVNEINILIIDDGCNDRTIEIAKRNGVQHFVRHISTFGLAKAFMSGLNYCLKNKADIIVNTDADNQYNADYIEKLIEPIISKKCDITIGARPINQIEQFSFIKKCLQKIGSFVVRSLSKTSVEDAPSGFRGFSREAAKKLIVFNEYTYTLETIIQAGYKNLKIKSVPIKVNEVKRKSRLVKSIPSYVRKSLITIFRVYFTYKPFRFFIYLSSLSIFIGLLISFRFLFFYLNGEGGGHIQSLILASVFLIFGFQNFLFALISDLISVNRKLLEDIRERLLKDD